MKVSAADGRPRRSEGVARTKLRPAVGDPKRPTPAESHLSFAGSCSKFRGQLSSNAFVFQLLSGQNSLTGFDGATDQLYMSASQFGSNF